MLEVDISRFFDTLDHRHLREILSRRVRDGVILRLIGKWLKAGVLERSELSRPEAGTPQGGVISPLLANIYLHEVVDNWFVREVQPRLQGRAVLVRYEDDLVFLFTQKEDADRVHPHGLQVRSDGGEGHLLPDEEGLRRGAGAGLRALLQARNRAQRSLTIGETR